MAYKTLEQINATDVTGIFQTASDAVPALAGMLLFAIFIVLAFGSMFAMQRRFGRRDYIPACFAVAGMVTTICAFIMSLIPNFIQTYIIVITTLITIVCILWFFSSSRD
jgi:DMSO/TMAO reductase YedYZ heme-binding membrane subunit